MAIGPRTTGRGITAPPRADCAHEIVGSGRVSGARVETHAGNTTGGGEAIADQMPGMGDHRPTVGRSQMIGRHESHESACLAHKRSWNLIQIFTNEGRI